MTKPKTPKNPVIDSHTLELYQRVKAMLPEAQTIELIALNQFSVMTADGQQIWKLLDNDNSEDLRRDGDHILVNVLRSKIL